MSKTVDAPEGMIVENQESLVKHDISTTQVVSQSIRQHFKKVISQCDRNGLDLVTPPTEKPQKSDFEKKCRKLDILLFSSSIDTGDPYYTPAQFAEFAGRDTEEVETAVDVLQEKIDTARSEVDQNLEAFLANIENPEMFQDFLKSLEKLTALHLQDPLLDGFRAYHNQEGRYDRSNRPRVFGPPDISLSTRGAGPKYP